MIRKMTALCMMIMFAVASSGAFAAAPPVKYPKSVKQTDDDFKLAYTINVPGKKISADYYSAAKKYRIPKVSPEHYVQGMIHIKTRQKFLVDAGDKGFRNSTLQSSISDLGIKSIRAPFEDRNAPSTESSEITKIYELTYSAPVDPYDVCRELMDNPEVEYAVPVFIHQPFEYTPNDPLLNNQWAVNNIELKKAWDISKGSKDVLIGIVDSGTQIDHPDLEANIWTNPNEIPDNGEDDDNNGKIDDVNGWDLVGNIDQNQAANGSFREDNNPKPALTSNHHGTHVAGCASAVTDNELGVAGTGFNCSLLPVKCSADNGSVQGIYRGYEGILYAARMGAKIINCSWGGPGFSPAAQEIINEVTEMGSIVVVAAGNDGSNLDTYDQYPAKYDNVLCVGASASNNKMASFSNYGHYTTVFTPGQSIRATYPTDTYSSQNGTSMASPVTAGVCGLVAAYHPDWSPKQIIHQIRSTSDNVLTSDPDLRPLLYGRINAYKALAYNDKNPQLSAPGCEITELSIEGSDVLDNFESRIINMETHNFLANVSDLKITITPMDKYVSIENSEFNIGVLSMNQTKDFDIRLRLLDINPWFEGYAKLLVKFEATNYTDYQMVRIPIQIGSNNVFNNVTALPDWFYAVFHSAKYQGSNVVWAAGQSAVYGGIYFKVGPNGSTINKATNNPVYAVGIINETTACLGDGPSNGSARIYRTVNTGSSWSTIAVNSITGFINDINFFDENNGIFLGDPLGENWGIGSTTDGGKTWARVEGIPAAGAQETGYVGSTYWMGDYGWFGTTTGRVYRTTNRGADWRVSTINSGSYVYYIGFIDENKGIAVYTESADADSDLLVASTSDGGNNWVKNKFNLTDIGLRPVNLFSPPESEMIGIIGSGGQVYLSSNMGQKWFPALSEEANGAQTGCAVPQSGNKMLVWYFSQYINNLLFNYIPPGAKKELTLKTGNKLVFDTLEVGKTKTSFAEIENTGEVDIDITNSVITDDDPQGGDAEFSFMMAAPEQIQIGQTERFRIRFKPAKAGLRKGELKVYSIADNSPLSVVLEGFAVDPGSVNEIIKGEGYSIGMPSPNPAHNKVAIPLEFTNPLNIRIDLVDMTGRIIGNLYDKENLIGSRNVEFDISEIPSGTYLIIIRTGGKDYARKLNIVR